MAAVTLRSLAKRFDRGAPAVDDVSLEIADGEFAVLVGPSGCGKTTVLRMIAGLEEPTSGSIAIGGRDVTDLPPGDRDVAVVFQNYALYPHFSVRENIGFGLKMRHVPARRVAQQVQEAAEMLGLDGLLDRRPSALSGGQRQRVALARAIVREPKVFLFDEPLSNLDAQIRSQTRAELVRLHRRLGATIVYVTHDQVEAMTMAQRVAVMDRGRLQQVATPMMLYRRPETRFVASFIGSPSINQLEGRVEEREGRSAFIGALTTRVLAPPLARAILAVRPEHVSLLPAGEGTHAVVALVEPLGPESHVLLRLPDGSEITARVSGLPASAMGDAVGVAVAEGEGLVYDAESGTLASR